MDHPKYVIHGYCQGSTDGYDDESAADTMKEAKERAKYMINQKWANQPKRTALARVAIVAVLFACNLFAQGPYARVPDGKGGKVAIPVSSFVYVTAHGKTYHTSPTCMALAKSGKPLQTTAKEAEAHGLTECKICLHRGATAGSGKKTFDNSWATYGGGK